MLNPGRYYIFAEYCPGDFFWGWWLYAAPLVDGQLDRTRAAWLDSNGWLDRLHLAIGLPPLHEYRYGNQTIYTHRFLEHFPTGLLLDVLDFYTWTRVMEPAPLWDYARLMREEQLLDWKRGAKEVSDATR